MKKALILLLPLALLMGCGGSASETNTVADSTAHGDSTATTAAGGTAEAAPAGVPATTLADPNGLKGYYVGMFEATEYKEDKNPSWVNKINLSIDGLADGKVEGHSVVAGNIRPFTGTYTMDGAKYKVEAAEPGDDKYDGKFSFTLDPATQKVTGTWTANSKKLSVTGRKYELVRKEFKYDPDLTLPESVDLPSLWVEYSEYSESGTEERVTDDAMRFNVSKVKLKKEDIQNMYKGDLEVMRNSIYARHGYTFKNRRIRYVFDQGVEWYIPVSTDVSKELTQLEQENIALIKRYEEHAENYYDSFGR